MAQREGGERQCDNQLAQQDDERIGNERTARGDATTSWRIKTTRGRRNERRHNLIVVWLHTESIGEVAAMVVARLDRKPEGLCVGDESQHLSDVVQHGLRTFRHHKDMQAKIGHLFVRVS